MKTQYGQRQPDAKPWQTSKSKTQKNLGREKLDVNKTVNFAQRLRPSLSEADEMEAEMVLITSGPSPRSFNARGSADQLAFNMHK